MNRIGATLGYKFRHPFSLEFVPVNLTKHSPSANLEGQLVAVRFLHSKELNTLNSMPDFLTIRFELNFMHKGRLAISMNASIDREANLDDCTNIRIRQIAKRIKTFGQVDQMRGQYVFDLIDLEHIIAKLFPNYSAVFSSPPRWLYHNGVSVPTTLTERQHDGEDVPREDRLLWFQSRYPRSQTVVLGVVSLSDNLRPNVSVSRNLLLNLPLQVHSAISLAGVRALKAAKRVESNRDLLSHFTTIGGSLLGNLLDDPLISSCDGWMREQIIKTENGFMSVTEIIKIGKKGGTVLLNIPSPALFYDNQYSTFIDCCAGALVQRHVRLNISSDGRLEAIPGDSDPICATHLLFPPLTFFPLQNKKLFMTRDGRVNSRHPFGEWLLNSGMDINDRFPGILHNIRSAILSDEEYTVKKQNINEHLTRLSLLDIDLKPPKKSYLT